MIEEIKSYGNVNLAALSAKQIIALLNLWDTNYAKKENASFSQMLSRCYQSRPWHKNAPINYIHADNKVVTTIQHAFFDLYEDEERNIVKALKEALRGYEVE